MRLKWRLALLIRMMKFRQFLDPGTAASVIIHAVLLASVLVFSGIRPFDSKGAQAITVDLVTPEEIKPPAKEEAPPPESKPPEFKLPDLALKDSLDKPSEPEQSAAPKPEAAEQPAPKPSPPTAETPQADTRQAAAPAQQPAPASPAPASPAPQAAPQPAAPAYKPPEPDVTVKYGVMLGLPAPADKGDFDNAAFAAAKISPQEIEAFRRHLKTCSPMPETISSADDVWIKLRATFTPDGRLAATPILIEGKASPKALALANGAIAAMQACQPYAMLPADKYNEWKILDLEFSPQDFNHG